MKPSGATSGRADGPPPVATRWQTGMAAFGRRIDHLAGLVRWRAWYASKLPLYIACMAYAALRTDTAGLAGLLDLAGLLALLSVFASFGHMVNDHSDRDIDRLVGKHRPFADWGEPAARIALVGFAILTVALAAALYDALTAALTVAAVTVAAAYSLRPARLKERPVLGWASAALAQRTIPVAIIFQALDAWDAAAVALTALATLIGLRFIIVHQLIDREKDRRTSVRTAVTIWSGKRLRTLYVDMLFPSEVVCAVAASVAMGIHEPAVAVVSVVYALGLWLALRRGVAISTVSYTILYELYCILWPVTLCALLAWRDPVFLPLLAVAIALVADQVRVRWQWARKRTSRHADPVEGVEPVTKNDADQQPTSGSAPVIVSSNPSPPKPGAGQRARRPPEPIAPKADPYPIYAQMRAEGPVHRRNVPGLGPTTLIPRYADGVAMLKDQRLIRDVRKPNGSGQPLRAIRGFDRGFGRDMLEMDPPDHTRLRKLVGKAFTPRTVEQLEGRVEHVAGRLIEQALPRGEIELISEFATSLPIRIITRLLGVPIADTERFRRFAFALSVARTTGPPDEALVRAKERFSGELRALFAKRREAPRDDLLTALVLAEQEGDRLSADELVAMVYLLLIGGFVTTSNLIGTGLLSLLRHPDQLELLRRDPGLIDSAVEELLRFESPLELSVASYASTDIELDGDVIRRGAAVRVVLPSANRDETKFKNPDVLDITRAPCPHLAFGHGIHFCLGAPLARLEGKIALRMLVERLPNLRLADPSRVEWLAHPVLRGLRRLPLRFDA